MVNEELKYCGGNMETCRGHSRCEFLVLCQLGGRSHSEMTCLT